MNRQRFAPVREWIKKRPARFSLADWSTGGVRGEVPSMVRSRVPVPRSVVCGIRPFAGIAEAKANAEDSSGDLPSPTKVLSDVHHLAPGSLALGLIIVRTEHPWFF